MFSSFTPRQSPASCGAAGFPETYENYFQIAAAVNTQTTPINPYTASGGTDIAFAATAISVALVEACQAFVMRVEFASFGDCNPCTTPDAVTREFQYFGLRPGDSRVIAPPNSRIVDVELKAVGLDLPFGPIVAADYTTGVALTKATTMRFYAETGTSPCCENMPAITNGRGTVIGALALGNDG
jgi:hypothetical protein